MMLKIQRTFALSAENTLHESINQPTNRPINQPINQSTNQSINQPINRPIRWMNESINRPIKTISRSNPGKLLRLDRMTWMSILKKTNESTDKTLNQCPYIVGYLLALLQSLWVRCRGERLGRYSGIERVHNPIVNCSHVFEHLLREKRSNTYICMIERILRERRD